MGLFRPRKDAVANRKIRKDAVIEFTPRAHLYCYFQAPSANDEVWRGFEHRLTRAITAVLDFAVPSRRRRQQISKELKGQESGN